MNKLNHSILRNMFYTYIIQCFCSEWYSILTRVKSAQDYELKQMHDEEANPRNAIGSLDVALIDSVIPVNLAAK